MIKLIDDNGAVESILYQVNESGGVTCVRYGPMQLRLAMEYSDRSKEVWLHNTIINNWRLKEPGKEPKALRPDPVLPKPIQLYRMLLGG